MKIFLKILGFTAIILFSFLKSQAKGRDVIIFLKDSTEVKGELLSVRDSLVVIYLKPLYNDMDIYYEYVRVEKFSNIENITAPGNNAITKSLWVGAAAIVGGITYNINGPRVTPKPGFLAESQPANSTGYVVMLMGPVISLAIGAAINKTELIFSFDKQSHEIAVKQDTVRMWQWADGILELKKIARFGADEPRHVREMTDAFLKETK